MSTETLKAALFLIALFVGLPLIILWSRDRISRRLWSRRNPPEKLAAERRAYEARILRPNWEFYERHLQRTAPPALRELFANGALVTSQDIGYRGGDQISTFDPLDEKGLIETRPWLSFDVVAIATTDAGDPIYLKPGRSEADTVYITHHDGGDTEVFAESVDCFMQQIKKSRNGV